MRALLLLLCLAAAAFGLFMPNATFTGTENEERMGSSLCIDGTVLFSLSTRQASGGGSGSSSIWKYEFSGNWTLVAEFNFPELRRISCQNGVLAAVGLSGSYVMDYNGTTSFTTTTPGVSVIVDQGKVVIGYSNQTATVYTTGMNPTLSVSPVIPSSGYAKAVAVDGEYLYVTQSTDDSNGRLFVYFLSNGSLTQDITGNIGYGNCVGANEGLVVVCDPAAASFAGEAIFYTQTASGLVVNAQQPTNPFPAGSFFPLEVVVADFVLMGSRSVDGDAGTNQGAAVLYTRNATMVAEVLLTKEERDEVGWALARQGGIMAVGAPDHDTPEEDAGIFGIYGAPELPMISMNTTIGGMEMMDDEKGGLSDGAILAIVLGSMACGFCFFFVLVLVVSFTTMRRRTRRVARI